ncbi:hypothetical protein [Paenibacillus sp. FJAT-27812]|uniref:hypothetical protein n=1 Tax=Paenibacillus sp. FJAT-27812 TaxID=1684143 RepID=UPI0006A792DD|nr:hypothetical protein [Paenibacillus sp. FJAT-27812]
MLSNDWLITTGKFKAEVSFCQNDAEIVMTNGLIKRAWRISPNAATVAFENLMTAETLIRGVKPEAMIEMNGQVFEVGGLKGQPDYAYLRNEWLDEMKSDASAFQFQGYELGATEERFAWGRNRFSDKQAAWPPPGVSLQLHFAPPGDSLAGIRLTVHYEMYDGIPLISKWLTIANNSGNRVKLKTFKSEILAIVEWESPVETPERWEYPNLHVESDYAFQGMTFKKSNRTTNWVPDPDYTTQINYEYLTPALLESRPPIGPDVWIGAGESFETFRTYELIHDSTDRERMGLAQRRMYRTLSPWVTENPIIMHVLSMEPDVIKEAIDQCAEVGFEMLILSFGSGLNMEEEDPDYIAKIKQLSDYAHGKGIEIGGYSLLASRSVSPEDDIVNPQGAYYIHSPCLESHWGQQYFQKVKSFLEQSGMGVFEHDGSYPGDICESNDHPGHHGKEDSQWLQWRRITDFYKWCRSQGIYLNVPDWYFLSGSNKTGMGYREVNWSLPRERQIVIGRQNIYDGTWEKTPSMGWMFVPLTEYHGGGADATMEPLSEHLPDYEAHLINNFSAGVQAIYRGFRLFDSEATKQAVKSKVQFFQKYRAILESDIIHIRRPSGRDIDCILHVNHALPDKGLAVVYNPMDHAVSQTLKLPLYYTGLTGTATVQEQEGPSEAYALDRSCHIELHVEIAPRSATWFLIH